MGCESSQADLGLHPGGSLSQLFCCMLSSACASSQCTSQCLPDSGYKFPLSLKNACHGGLKRIQMTTFWLVLIYNEPISDKVTFRSYGLLASIWGWGKQATKIINHCRCHQHFPKAGFLSGVCLFICGKTLVFSFLELPVQVINTVLKAAVLTVILGVLVPRTCNYHPNSIHNHH